MIVCIVVLALGAVLCALAYDAAGRRWASMADKATLDLNRLFQQGRFHEAYLLHGRQFREFESVGTIEEILFILSGFSSALGWGRASARCTFRAALGCYTERLLWDVRQHPPKLINFQLERDPEAPASHPAVLLNLLG